MPRITLNVTRASAAAGEAIAPQPGKPLFRGTGDTDYVCGECGYVIAANMGPTQRVIIDTTICAACGAENEFPIDLRG